MNKEKVVIYLKINSNDKNKMEKEQKYAIDYCNQNNLEIIKIVKDYKNNSSLEDLLMYICDKDNEIYNLVINNFNMLADNNEDIYEYYKYLKDECHCNLITLTHGTNYHFEINIRENKYNEQ